MHLSSLDKIKKFKENHLDKNKYLKILDIGSLDVNGTYVEIFREPNWIYHGADITAGKNVDIVLKNPYDWHEIKTNSYDVVISGQAFEHIEYIWITMLQINRILKLGGIACIVAPADGFEHRYPQDCWRFYPDGFKALSRWARMEVIEAYTQWDSLNYPDGSDIWKDSVLICKKITETPALESMIELLNQWIDNENNNLLGYEKKDQALQREIEEIHNSFTWKTLRKYDKLKSRLVGSKRVND